MKLDELGESPPVALLTFGAGDEGLLVGAVARAGYRALVVEATGGGHVTARTVEDFERLAAEMPVVLAPALERERCCGARTRSLGPRMTWRGGD